ncbi:MAG: NAD-dependent epimerase/dehydratase family protein [Rhodothermales bacterium]|nr:NAD-dependent epimerase/dehydratase family protein [Rhodothermales bacterium]MBO6781026.1 NAD-dependent epimerase/dehydratase family protein [Rhodothermales bacterium]
MTRIGITGANGFLGTHLRNVLGLAGKEFELVDFDRAWFDAPRQLDDFVRGVDAIVHLAALNRHHDPDEIFNTNTGITRSLIDSLLRTGETPHVLISSSVQEFRPGRYGDSKRESRLMLADWAKASGANFTGLVIPNLYGPFGHPRYNSVVATFCSQVSRGQEVTVENDPEIDFLYVGSLAERIVAILRARTNEPFLRIEAEHSVRISELKGQIEEIRHTYQEGGAMPRLRSQFDRWLFLTYQCYMPLGECFPKALSSHSDERGSFVEVLRARIDGQVSFSTTNPGITRGNHYHTRKTERFAVIKGVAEVAIRQIGTDQRLVFRLDATTPSFVDMPIWHTHNITNVGEEPLYTVFWISEEYDPTDPDTYFEVV